MNAPNPVDASAFVSRLRAGDETAFNELVNRYHASMVRVARAHVRDDATAEETAQDAWLAILSGLDGLRSEESLRGWMFAIVVNKARTRAKRDARSLPFSALAQREVDVREAAVPPDRFQGPDGRYPDGWAVTPASWGPSPEERLERQETMQAMWSLIDELPHAQRAVLTLRDVAGQDPSDICNVLGISETNMRVLLHRGRSKVRAGLERYFSQREGSNLHRP